MPQVPLEERDDHDACYGQGCAMCGFRGWFESSAHREAREAWEDDAYDRWKDERLER